MPLKAPFLAGGNVGIVLLSPILRILLRSVISVGCRMLLRFRCKDVATAIVRPALNMI